MIRRLGPDDFAKGMMFLALFIAGVLFGAATGGWDNLQGWISALSGWFAGGAALWIGLVTLRPLLGQARRDEIAHANARAAILTRIQRACYDLEDKLVGINTVCHPNGDVQQIIRGESVTPLGAVATYRELLFQAERKVSDYLPDWIELPTPTDQQQISAAKSEVVKCLSSLRLFIVDATGKIEAIRFSDDSDLDIVAEQVFLGDIVCKAPARPALVRCLNQVQKITLACRHLRDLCEPDKNTTIHTA